MSAILCLIGLERPDGHAELLAVLDVGQHHLEQRVAGADGLERQGDGRLLEGAGTPSVGGVAARARRAPGRRGRARGRSVAVERGRLASSEREGVSPASAAGDDERTDAVPDPGHHGDLAARRGIREHAELAAVEDPAALGPLGRHGHVVEGPTAGGGRRRPRCR